MATSRSEALRREVESQPRGRGQLYADDLRERLTTEALSQRATGASWAEISSELGVSAESLRRWCPLREATALVAVRVVADRANRADADRRLAVISPTGFRVEGLTLDEATAMLRALQ